MVCAVDYLITVHISAEAVVHRVLPDRYRDFPVELVIDLVVVSESTVNGTAQYDSAIQITVFINRAMGRTRVPVERLGGRL